MLDELQSAALADPDPVRWSPVEPVLAVSPRRSEPEATDLQIPKSIWQVMAVAYTLFFGGLLVAVGSETSALFMVAISVAYTLMFFGTSAILFGMNRPRTRSLFELGIGPLQTWTGPMSRNAVAGQILAVPLCLALFGVTIAVIARAVGL
jgi:hypothetical protein